MKIRKANKKKRRENEGGKKKKKEMRSKEEHTHFGILRGVKANLLDIATRDISKQIAGAGL